MKPDFSLLSKIPLFSGIAPADYPALLQCVGAQTATYDKGAFLSLSGEAIKSIGIVLTGRVQILKEDVFGNRAILNDLGPGNVFGESFICGGRFSLTVSILAAESSSILLLSFDQVMRTCDQACAHHNALIKNMLVMIAQKNIALLENWR